MTASGADGLSQSDLAGSFSHRDEHDVHDSDAADEQRHQGHPAQHNAKDPQRPIDGFEEFALISNSDIVHAIMALDQEGVNVPRHRLHFVTVWHVHEHEVDMIVSGEAAHRRGDGNKDQLIIIGPVQAPFGFHDSDDTETLVPDLDFPVERRPGSEELLGDISAQHYDPSPLVDILLDKESPHSGSKVADLLVFGHGAGDLTAVIPISSSELFFKLKNRCHEKLRAEPANRQRVAILLSCGASREFPLFLRCQGCVEDEQQIGAEALDRLDQLPLSPFDDRSHGDNRRHADDDTQHRQPGPQLVG